MSFTIKGKVQSYWLDTSSNYLDINNHRPYFKVIIKNDEREVEFVQKLLSSSVDENDWHVRLSQIQQAAIATIKDALIHNLDVQCYSKQDPDTAVSRPGMGEGTYTNNLQEIEIFKR
jgi:hypothetical protein